MSNNNLTKALEELSITFTEHFYTDVDICEAHGHDQSGWETYPPNAVLFVQSTDDVSRAMKICHAHQLPIIAFGTGSSVEGHVQALHGGLCIDLSQMNQIIQLNSDDMDCHIQAGVTREQMNQFLADSGLFFSVDPGANASIGGMAATGASGSNTVRYGSIRDNVRTMTVVLADGSIIKTGSRAKKSSAEPLAKLRIQLEPKIIPPPNFIIF